MPIDTPTLDNEGEFGAEQVAAQAAAEAFRRLIYAVVPPKTYGQVRIGKATHHRFIAFVWLYAPEVFEGRSQEQMAAMLGITCRAFEKQLAVARATVTARKAKK